MSVRVCVCVHVNVLPVFVSVCVYLCVCLCLHFLVSLCTCGSMCILVSVYIFVCVCTLCVCVCANMCRACICVCVSMPVCDVRCEKRDGARGLAPTAHKQVSMCTCQAWGSENPPALLADRNPQLSACGGLSGASPGRGRRLWLDVCSSRVDLS